MRVVGVITVDGVITTPAPVRSFSWGVKVPTAGGVGGGGGAGKAQFDPLVVVRTIDADSPEMFLTAATGKHIAKVTLDIYQEGTTTVLASYQFEDVSLTVDTHGDAGRPGGAPLEEVSFLYSKIKLKVGGNEAGFDLKANSKT
jgi:type VI secretion system secreted protein Hcp